MIHTQIVIYVWLLDINPKSLYFTTVIKMKGVLIGNLDFRNQGGFLCGHKMWAQEDEQFVPT